MQYFNNPEALIRLVEHYMLGQGPAFDAPIKGQVIKSERALEGQAQLDTVRVFYGPGFQGHFDMSVLYKDDGRKKPAITWSLFSYTGPCPVERELVLERGYVLCSFYREQLTPDAPMKTGPAYWILGSRSPRPTTRAAADAATSAIWAPGTG